MLYNSLTDVQEQIEEEARKERCDFCLTIATTIYGFTSALIKGEPMQIQIKQPLLGDLPVNRHA